MTYFFAAYKGDKFLRLTDTAAEMATELNVKVSTVRWLTYPASHKRFAGTNHVLIYKYKIEGEM